VLGGPSAWADDPYTFGGSGDSYDVGAMTNDVHLGGPLVTLSSAADQSFAMGYAPVASVALTITDDLVAPGISNGMSLAVRIPAGFTMAWDETVLNPIFGGTAAGKVSNTVSYTNSNQRLVIAVTNDFIEGDILTVSALAFKNYIASGSTHLELNYDPDGFVDALDDKTITIYGVYAGGLGDSYSLDQMLFEKCLHPVGTVMSICGIDHFEPGYPLAALVMALPGAAGPGL